MDSLSTRPKTTLPLSLALAVVGLVGCSSSSSPHSDSSASDGQRIADSRSSDASADATDADGSLPFGWVSPRCGNSLVVDCAACPGKPLTCNACKNSATCVANCSSDCAQRSECKAAGTCIEPGELCGPNVLCGCPGDTKPCLTASQSDCLGDCDQCAGKQVNWYGRCDALRPALGGCPDGPGPEYFCSQINPDNTGRCADTASCDSCGPGYCVSGSCSDAHCEPGFIAGKPFYSCGKRDCCSDGFWCPATKGCVKDCASCSGYQAGACGKNGACVAKCSDCFASPQGAQISVCDGVCTDTNSDVEHCGSCKNACPNSGGFNNTYGCAQGHCCESKTPPLDWVWCPTCNCCVEYAQNCLSTACSVACLAP